YISFLGASSVYANVPLPSTASPTALLAPFWDDVDTTLGSSGAGGNRAVFAAPGPDGGFVVNWTNLHRSGDSACPTASTLTFQAVLYPDGRVLFRYLDMRGALGSGTIGIDSASGLAGLQYTYADSGVASAFSVANLAIEFRPGQPAPTSTP